MVAISLYAKSTGGCTSASCGGVVNKGWQISVGRNILVVLGSLCPLEATTDRCLAVTLTVEERSPLENHVSAVDG